ncbi:arginine N-succinyltransferase [Simiduia sp. 21SJ11W-1]|uniref:arginine N-succinyltransferase n=1 Tax=Simiduia sp. 21SJ11W-1 TaxID=2909669 RepID=UPI00209EDFB7|nr:arginine N-succinyltransferase [Simiduia sp. 21SJ11W-1]UTA47715.1 arginine N-succinyltransferase [Simiduia sp. 21SJ11W-1]
MFVRPCVQSDLAAVERLAFDSPVGLTSLPEDSGRLAERLARSEQSFAKNVSTPGDEEYLFALIDEASGELVGISGLVAKSGVRDPYFNFRRERYLAYSQTTGESNRLARLLLVTDNQDKTVLSAFFIHAQYRNRANIELLSRARILFMASFPERFCEEVIVEFVGVTNHKAESPFWNAVGRAFFNMEYDQAEHYCGTLSKAFIGELAPPYPIYEALLNDDARSVIGKAAPEDADVIAVAKTEGFVQSPHVDIFDAGPCFTCRRDYLYSLRNSQVLAAANNENLPAGWFAPLAVQNFMCVASAERHLLGTEHQALRYVGEVPAP